MIALSRRPSASLTREREQYARASRVSASRVQPPRARQLLSTEEVITERKVDRSGVDTRELLRAPEEHLD